MAVKRKCPGCGTWNGEESHCTVCGEVLSPQLIEERREHEREIQRRNEPKTDLDRFVERWEHSPYLALRISYKIFYSVMAVIMAISCFFAWLILGTYG